jgi:hypothetical protein
VLKARVANICFNYFRCFRGMFQIFHMDVAKVDRDVTHVASVSEACCKCLFKMFHLFQTYVASVLIWMLYMFSHICCKSIFQMFQLFYSYVAVSV